MNIITHGCMISIVSLTIDRKGVVVNYSAVTYYDTHAYNITWYSDHIDIKNQYYENSIFLLNFTHKYKINVKI